MRNIRQLNPRRYHTGAGSIRVCSRSPPQAEACAYKCCRTSVAHSTNGFPVRTGAEFPKFLRGAAAFGAGKPEELRAFLAAHPNAYNFTYNTAPEQRQPG